MARLYARVADIAARIVHVPRAVLAATALIARPIHPGIARVMRIAGLPDDAFPEAVEAGRSVGAHEIGATTLEEFVHARVNQHRTATSAAR